MKIMNVMPFPPVPPNFGAALREFHLLKSLASEHDVTVLTYGTEEDLKCFQEELGDEIDEVYMIPPPWERKFRRLAQLYAVCSDKSYFHMNNCSGEMQSRIDTLLATENFDAVHCEFSVMGGLNFDDNVLKIVNTHNVEYENFRRMFEKTDSSFRKWFYRQEFEKVYTEEIENLKNQDAIFSTSEQDKAIFDKHLSSVPNYVVPNGVDTSYFNPSESEEIEPKSIVFTGMMGYVPNSDGMHWFLDKIFPLIQEEVPDAKVYIVGKQPPASLRNRATDNIIVTGFVDDVRPFVRKASVFVVPLRMGSGTRLKVVEALSMKKPVVSTALGCEGIEVEDGKSIIIKDEPEAFAKSVVELFTNEEKRKQLSETGHQLVKEKYDWSVVCNSMLQVYDELAAPARLEEESKTFLKPA